MFADTYYPEKMMHQFLDSRQFWEHVYALNLADDLEELGLGIEPESPASSQLTGYLDRRGNEEGEAGQRPRNPPLIIRLLGGDTSDQLSGQEAQQAQQSQVSDDLGDVLRPAILHPEDGQLLGDRFPAAACLALLRSNIQFDKLTRLKKDKASAEDRLREAERAVMTYLRSINKDGLATVIRMGYGVDATIRKNVPEAWDAPEVMEYYPAEQQALEMATAVRDAEARLKAFDFAAVATIGKCLADVFVQDRSFSQDRCSSNGCNPKRCKIMSMTYTNEGSSDSLIGWTSKFAGIMSTY